MGDLEAVLDDVVKLFEGAPNWGNPLTMCNVIPQANIAGMVASMLSQVFSLNIVDGEYAWNAHRAELETAGMVGNLFGWSATGTGAIYTYGGSGCWAYGLKYGLTRVLPESRQKGVRKDAKIICSRGAHYAHQNGTDWMGLGTDNIVLIRTDIETNQMDLGHLEEVLRGLILQGTPVVTVVCTMGTTDASAFDPIAGAREVLDRYPNPEGFGKAVLYADAVVGWSWSYFKDYDFERNPLGFSDRVLPLLRRNGEAMSELIHADAVGVDFHKTGWAPYVSSCFLYKDAAEFESIHRRGNDAYLQERTPYNPMYHTLEVSRSASGSLAGWATLKYFGMEGMQALLGGILETKVHLSDLLEAQSDMVCVNPENTGLVTLFRIYPEDMEPKTQFWKELTEPASRANLLTHNRLIEAVGDKLFEWFRAGKVIDDRYTPYLSFTRGFRETSYNRDGDDAEGVIYALKLYPMNVFITPETMEWALYCVRMARDEVLANDFSVTSY